MGYRLTGSLEYKIIEHATGYNPLNLMIEKALTGTSEVINLNPNFEKKYCNITFLLTPGVIDRIEGVEEVKALSNVIDLFLSYDEGDEITPDMEGTLAQVVARVFAYGNTEEEVFNTMKKVIELFRVYSIENKEMIIPFEVKNLYF